MPEVAANTTEAVLLSWPIAENRPFSRRDTIATVETAKAVVDVEAEADGVILRTLVAEGTEVAVGEPIALIAHAGEQVPDLDAALVALGHTPDAKGLLALEVPEADPMPTVPVTAGETTSATTVNGAEVTGADVTGGNAYGRLFSSPLARRLAREADVPVSTLIGTGPHQRIVRRDVEDAIRQRRADEAGGARLSGQQMTQAPAGRHTLADSEAGGAAPAGAAAPAGPTAPTGEVAPFVDVPHSRQRRLIAARLTASKQTTPHFYLRGTARVDALLALRGDVNDGAAVRISVNDLVIAAVARAHMLVPALNVTWSDDAIRQFSSVDVAVAVSTGSGLVTPVLREVQARTVTDIAGAVRDYVVRAQSGQLRQRDLEGGSITVTNLGMYGVEEFAAIINPPQASILAVGVAREEPHVRKGKVRIATMMHLTLSVDHRAVDGAQAAQWMSGLLALLEHPARILA
jgi:pyruvate dehydrogenase E2 component (dihydrolipoamide acetyltransferase)